RSVRRSDWRTHASAARKSSPRHCRQENHCRARAQRGDAREAQSSQLKAIGEMIMAKTATKVSSIDAQKVIDDLEAKKSALALARANDESGMAAIAYEAHTGDQKAQAKLETLRERALRRDLEMRNLESALTEAKRRLVAAQEAEREAEEARVAGELAELAQMMREAGAKCDRALKLLAESSNELW